jgi:hypothetical protein
VAANRRVLVVAVVAALAVAVVAAAIVRVSGDSSDGEAGSTTSSTEASNLGFPAPTSADAAADRDYLDGDGRVLLVMHERAAPMAGAQLTSERCEQEAQVLDQEAPADEVLARIGGLADYVLRDAFHAERTALGVALTQCISGQAGDDRAPELAPAIEAVDVRLSELGD